MENNISSSQEILIDVIVNSAHKWGSKPKPTPAYPTSLTGIVRQMKKDLKKDFQFLIKDKNVKEIKITKIDRKKHIIYLWIYKKDRKYIARILSLLDYYPFKRKSFLRDFASIFLLKCTVEINPKIIPRGIVILN